MSLLGQLSVGIVGNMSDLSGTLGQAAKEVQNFGKKAQNLGRDISKVGDTLTRRITMPAVAAASALTGITLVKGFQRLVGIDTAQAKLKGLGHDAQSVEEIMTSALDSVRGTAYGLDEAATTAANAVAAGIAPGEELTRYLTLTGDAAAIAGSSMGEMGSIINKVQTAQKAYTGELNQLADRGIPIFQWLAEEAGTTAEGVREMASDGAISSEMFLKAIENNIGGAAKTMGEESFTAGIANIGAAIGRLGAEFLDAGGEGEGFFSTIKPLISEAIGYIDGLADKATELGTKFGEAFNNIIDRVTQVRDWFTGLSDDTQKLILRIAGIGAAVAIGIGPALAIIGRMITGFGTLTKAVGLLFGPFGIAIAVIGALVAAGILLYQNWDTIKEKATEVFSSFSPLLETVKGAFQNLIESLSPIWESLKELFQSLLPILQDIGLIVGGVLVTAFGLAISIFNGAIAAIGPLINAFINLLDMVINVVNSIVALFKGDFQSALDFWQDATQSAIDFVMSLWDGIVSFFATFIQTIIDFFQGLYMTLVGNSIIPDMVNAIVEWFQNMFGWLIDIVSNIVDGVVEFFTSLYDRAVEIFESLWGALTDIWSYIENTFKNALSFLLSLVTGDFEGMKNAATNQMENARDLLSNIWERIKTLIGEKASQILSDIIAKFIEIKDNITNKITEAKDNLVNKFTEMVTNAKNKGSEIVRTVKEKFEEAKNKITEPIEKAKETISGIVDDIKGFFSNMKLKLPKIEMPKLPKFSLKGGFSLNPPSVPKLNVNWNAIGGIFRKPTIFNTANAGLQGVGEAGAEAILPLNKRTLGMIGEGIASTINSNNQQLNTSRLERLLIELIRVVKDKDLVVDEDSFGNWIDGRLSNNDELYNYMRGNK